ncbi:AAA family ATPase [Candidatus Kaiserbacteria bacterium]|nr:AAA family ATPase [Candidatus Kaiserbacteria bacterium]
MLIGITGTLGAGKGAVVDYLVAMKKFRHVSARHIWTEELESRQIPVNRDTMTKLANDLRAKHGPAYFVERALETVKNDEENVVVESIRTVAEAELLKSRGGVLLVVNADKEERYRRISGRNSALDKVSFAEFVRQEENEMTNEDPNKQNIAKVIEMADYTIENNSTLDALTKSVEEFLKQMTD